MFEHPRGRVLRAKRSSEEAGELEDLTPDDHAQLDADREMAEGNYVLLRPIAQSSRPSRVRSSGSLRVQPAVRCC